MSSKKLVLHFDVNHTIVLVDSCMGLSMAEGLEDALQRHLRTSALGHHLGYHKKHISPDTLRTLLHQTLGKLRWREDDEDPLLTLTSNHKIYHYVFPAFYHLLNKLLESKQEFVIILRTFGTDGGNVLKSIEHALSGNHPVLRDCDASKLKVHRPPGRVVRSRRSTQVQLTVSGDNTPGDTSDNKVLEDVYDSQVTFCDHRLTLEGVHAKVSSLRTLHDKLSTLDGIHAVKDNFEFWAQNGYSSTGGKPVWVDLDNPDVHHILFDDNIRAHNDGLADLFVLRGDTISRGKDVNMKFINTCLVPVNVVDAIHDLNYFIDKLTMCQDNYAKLLDTDASNDSPHKTCSPHKT